MQGIISGVVREILISRNLSVSEERRTNKSNNLTDGLSVGLLLSGFKPCLCLSSLPEPFFFSLNYSPIFLVSSPNFLKERHYNIRLGSTDVGFRQN